MENLDNPPQSQTDVAAMLFEAYGRPKKDARTTMSALAAAVLNINFDIEKPKGHESNIRKMISESIFVHIFQKYCPEGFEVGMSSKSMDNAGLDIVISTNPRLGRPIHFAGIDIKCPLNKEKNPGSKMGHSVSIKDVTQAISNQEKARFLDDYTQVPVPKIVTSTENLCMQEYINKLKSGSVITPIQFAAEKLTTGGYNDLLIETRDQTDERHGRVMRYIERGQNKPYLLRLIQLQTFLYRVSLNISDVLQ